MLNIRVGEAGPFYHSWAPSKSSYQPSSRSTPSFIYKSTLSLQDTLAKSNEWFLPPNGDREFKSLLTALSVHQTLLCSSKVKTVSQLPLRCGVSLTKGQNSPLNFSIVTGMKVMPQVTRFFFSVFKHENDV